MSGWDEIPLEVACQIKPSKKELLEIISEDDPVSFVPMDQLGIDQKYFGSDQTKPLRDVIKSYTYFKERDVILAKITPCFENGKLGIAKNLRNGIGFGSSEFIVYRATENLLPEYLYYFLSQSRFREEGERVMTGAVGHKRIPKDFYEKYLIPFPTFPEQQQIVSILDRVFAAIDQAKANLERNIENAKELFQSKLNDIFSQKGDGWEEKRLGEVSDLFQGLAINAKTKHLLVDRSSLPLLRIKDLKNNTEEQYVTEQGYPKKALVEEDDIIYTRTGSLGLVFRGRRGVLHNNSFKVVPSNELSKNYLFWWMQHDKFKSIIISLASRAAQPDITHKLFKQQIIRFPSIEDQELIYDSIVDLNSFKERIISLYENKIIALEELKKSILQQAFSGELTEDFQVEEELAMAAEPEGEYKK
jgi:type I restriction enzyme S subunit